MKPLNELEVELLQSVSPTWWLAVGVFFSLCVFGLFWFLSHQVIPNSAIGLIADYIYTAFWTYVGLKLSLLSWSSWMLYIRGSYWQRHSDEE